MDIKNIKACILLLKFGTHIGRLFYWELTLSVQISSFTYKFIYVIMAEVIRRNVVPNFNYTVKASILFRCKIILNKFIIYQNTSFMKIEKDLKVVIQLSADFQFVKQ